MTDQLTADEADSLRSQFVTLKLGRGQHRKYLPFAFTEQAVFQAIRQLMSPPPAPKKRRIGSGIANDATPGAVIGRANRNRAAKARR